MAWEWSHSSDAYENARANLDKREREWLEVVYAEWEACEDENAVCARLTDQYDAKLVEAKGMSEWELRNYIWDRMERFRLCTNGGHKAYGCPFGCPIHHVPFDRE